MPGSPIQTPPPQPKPKPHRRVLLSVPALLAVAFAVLLAASPNPLPRILRLLLGPKSSLLRPTEIRPSVDASPDAGRPPCVLWMAPFASGGGYCSEAWSYVASLDEHATAASANFTLAIAHHGDLESPEFWLGLPEQSKKLPYRLATARCELSRAVVVCHSEPGAWYPPMYESLPCPPTGYDEPAFVIGRTMFETDRLSPEHVRRCNQMDAIWVPTDFHVSTFVKSGVDPSKVVKVVQAVDVGFFHPAKHTALPLPIGVPVLVLDDSRLGLDGSKGKGFVFLSVFKWEQRKGWDVLLRAFLQEFSGADDVALYLLINAYHSDTDFSRKIRSFVKESSIEEPTDGWAEVRLIGEHVPQSALPRLYKAADAFVLPSRGEGWGRPVVEAMSMELPVIVTDWSGPTEYLTEENGYPLDIDRMAEVTEGPFKGHLCAEPSVDHLRTLMRHVFSDREEARRKGKKAREDMVERFSPAIVARIVADQLQQTIASTR
uniref:Glycosyl transferase family 1 domain-containing protein n=1 Tax=Oryza brachyantha TaxID=4533 RepID=J3MW91_ORYBR